MDFKKNGFMTMNEDEMTRVNGGYGRGICGGRGLGLGTGAASRPGLGLGSGLGQGKGLGAKLNPYCPYYVK